MYKTDLAIIIPTLNRVAPLRRMLDSIKQKVMQPAQLIIIDGGSTDGTLELIRTWATLCRGKPITLIEQGEALGAIPAIQEGVLHLDDEIKYVFIANDDCEIVDNSVDLSTQLLDRDYHQAVGQIAIPFTCHGRLKLDYVTLVKRRWLYANFGVTRRELGDRVSWWNVKPVDGKAPTHYGGDCALSMKCWNLDYAVLGLRGSFRIKHLELQDETRRPNSDSELFYKRWSTWNGPYDDDFLQG